MKRILWSFLLSVLCGSLNPAWAQPQVATQREEMKKLDFMVGEWKGEGWIEMGERSTFTQTETVQSKLDGLVLQIEGVGTSKPPGQESEVVVHNALALVSYDDQAKRFRFLGHTAEGHYGDRTLTLIDGGWQWGLEYPGGQMRYTMKLTKNGEWWEIGEGTSDGKTWHKFFEMTLQRVK